MARTILCISEHSFMLGGGEHSFLDLLHNLPASFKPIAVVPSDGKLSLMLKKAEIETRILEIPSIRPWTLPKMLKTVIQLIYLYNKYQPVLIYANGMRAVFYAGITRILHKCPVIWHCRIADRDPYFDFILERLSTKIIVNSKVTRNRFRPHFQQKIILIYNGLDLKWLQDYKVKKASFIKDGWKVILVAARVSKLKRHDLVISAFEHIAEPDPNIHLVCIGAKDESEPDWWDILQERTCRSKFADRIHWIGHVKDVRPWYHAASVLVLTSETESFGRVLVEAMACGVPVIATLSGGIPEIVRHEQDGLLVGSGKSEEIAFAMKEILYDKALRERFAKSAKERAQDFSLESHVAKMAYFFENTIRVQS